MLFKTGIRRATHLILRSPSGALARSRILCSTIFFTVSSLPAVRSVCRYPKFFPPAVPYDSPVGDDRRHQPGGGKIKSGIQNLDPGGGQPSSLPTADLIFRPLLDGDMRSVRQGSIYCGKRSRDIKRQTVPAGKDRQSISADFINHITIGGNTVGAGDNRLHQPFLHYIPGGIVGDQSYGYLLPHQFPSC